MPRKFDFISPGIQLTEVDESALPQVVSEDLGPLIIGRSLSGPAMKPIRVKTLDDFNTIFGLGISGKGSQDNDVWRNGNTLGPTYGVYAAQAHLASQTTPVTYVRLLGEANSAADSNSELAGWSLDNAADPDARPLFNASAYGLFIFPSSSYTAGTVPTGSLAAVFYVTGAAMALSGNITDGGLNAQDTTQTATASVGTLIDSIGGTANKFAISLMTDADTEGEKFTFDFTAGSSNYIRDVISTNPQLIKGNKNFGLSNKSYFLGETYEAAVASNTNTAAGKQFGILLALHSGSLNWADHFKDMLPAKTGWFINRKPHQEKLFRCIAIHDGEWIQNNYEIQISSLSLGDTSSPNSTFTLEVVAKDGTVVEQFAGLNLDPSSENYISKVIGDQYLEWDSVNTKYNVRGEYVNNSDYIYIEVTEAVKNQQISDTHKIPVGFYGPLRPIGFTLLETRPNVHQFGTTNEVVAGHPAQALITVPTTATTDAQSFHVTGAISGAAGEGYFRFDAHTDAESVPNFGAIGTTTNPLGTGSWVGSGTHADPYIFEGMMVHHGINAANAAGQDLRGTFYAAAFDLLPEYNASYDSANNIVTIEATSSITTVANLTVNVSAYDAISTTSTVAGASPTAQEAHAFVRSNASVPCAGGSSGEFARLPNKFTGSLQFPSLKLTTINSNVNGTNYEPTDVYGVRHSKGTSANRDDSYIDIIRVLPSNASNTLTHHQGENASLPDSLEYSFVFAMDDIMSGSTTTEFYHNSGSHELDASVQKSVAAELGLDKLFEKKVRQFRVPLFGGHNGLDLTEVEPFSNKNLTDKTRLSSYAYNSVFKAIETISDPESVNYDIIAAPGFTSTDVTDKIMSLASQRQDCLAIIDLPGGYKPGYEDNGTVATGDINGTITNLNGRLINNSYAAAYYPWVRLRDRVGGQNDVLYVPPSVAAVGALAKSQGMSELWFAPAGFNRGGINELGGPDGPIITGTWEHLTKTDRDDLYTARINPIARFPSLNQIVIFGQKTLQNDSSALDRINVRRLLIYLKYQIGLIANTILFDQNVSVTWSRFKFRAERILGDARARLGISEYKLVLDNKTTTADLVDRNIMYAKIFIKPVRSVEFIAVDFIISRTGVQF